MLLVSYVSMLVTGDGLTAHDFKLAQPPGISILNILLSTLSAAIGAFIIAATFGAKAPIYQGSEFETHGCNRYTTALSLALDQSWLTCKARQCRMYLAGWSLSTGRSVIFTLS